MSWTALVESSPIGPMHVMTTDSSSPPILFLHGVTRSSRDWMGLAAGLVSRWKPYCLDFRGHGDSPRTPGAYRVAQYVEDAIHLAHHAIARPFIVVGHSLGAMVATAVAERCKHLVLGAVLEDPPFDTMGGRIAETAYLSQFTAMQQILREEQWHGPTDLARKLADIMLTDPRTGETTRMGDRRDLAALRFHASCLLKMDPECLTPIVEGNWLEGFPWRRYVEGIDCPILLIQADAAVGGMLVDEDAEVFSERAADVTRVQTPGLGHALHQAQPEALLRVIVPFLESLSVENPF